MDGLGNQKLRTAEDVYQARKENALFGLVEPMPWVGHQELIDFLDFLFSRESDVLRKLNNSVRYNHYLTLTTNKANQQLKHAFIQADLSLNLRPNLLAVCLKIEKEFQTF
jgi:hypothetical protein